MSAGRLGLRPKVPADTKARRQHWLAKRGETHTFYIMQGVAMKQYSLCDPGYTRMRDSIKCGRRAPFSGSQVELRTTRATAVDLRVDDPPQSEPFASPGNERRAFQRHIPHQSARGSCLHACYVIFHPVHFVSLLRNTHKKTKKTRTVCRLLSSSLLIPLS